MVRIAANPGKTNRAAVAKAAKQAGQFRLSLGAQPAPISKDTPATSFTDGGQE